MKSEGYKVKIKRAFHFRTHITVFYSYSFTVFSTLLKYNVVLKSQLILWFKIFGGGKFGGM